MSIRTLLNLGRSHFVKSHKACQKLCWEAPAAVFSSSINDEIPTVSLDFLHNGAVAILTLCNPKRRNALTYAMMEQLDDHVTTLERWAATGIGGPGSDNYEKRGESKRYNNSRAIILTGARDTFCSGLDLHDHASSSHHLQSGSQMNLHMTHVTNRLHCLSVPSIAAVDGNAIGGGAELTTCTDFVVLSTNARVQFVHVKRGASPGWGGGRRLVNKVGRRKALKMLLLGEAILGEDEAKELYYADGVGNEGETAIDAAVRLIVAPLLELPCSDAIRAIKSVVSAADGDRNVLESEGNTLLYDTHEPLAVEREAFLSVWGGDSNKKQIQETKDRLEKKKLPASSS